MTFVMHVQPLDREELKFTDEDLQKNLNADLFRVPFWIFEANDYKQLYDAISNYHERYKQEIYTARESITNIKKYELFLYVERVIDVRTKDDPKGELIYLPFVTDISFFAELYFDTAYKMFKDFKHYVNEKKDLNPELIVTDAKTDILYKLYENEYKAEIFEADKNRYSDININYIDDVEDFSRNMRDDNERLNLSVKD